VDDRPCAHLSWREVNCRDGTPYPTKWHNTRLIALTEMFESFREYVGNKPLIIGSCYRTPSWNRKQGGAPQSQHVQGKAIDIHCPSGIPLNEFHSMAKSFAQSNLIEIVGGLGWYEWGVHMDVRTRRKHRMAFWNKAPMGTLLHDIRNA